MRRSLVFDQKVYDPKDHEGGQLSEETHVLCVPPLCVSPLVVAKEIERKCLP